MRKRTARGIVFQIVAEHLHALVAGVAERHVARDVRREQQIFRAAQRVVGGQRLRHDHVERHAGEPPGVERVAERLLVDGGSAADVHDEGAVGQQRDALAREDAHGLRRGGQRHHKDIRFGQDAVQLRDGMDGGERRVGGSDRAAHAGDARGMEGLRAAGKLRADVARAEHGDARAMQRADTAGERFPAAVADDLGILHLAAQQHQADHDEMLGDGGAVGAGGVGEQAVGVLIDTLVAEMIHARPTGAVPFEAFRTFYDLARAMPVEDLTVVHPADRFSGRGEILDLIAVFGCRRVELTLVFVVEKVDDDADLFSHAE